MGKVFQWLLTTRLHGTIDPLANCQHLFPDTFLAMVAMGFKETLCNVFITN